MLRRFAALALLLPLAGCSPLVDEEQKKAVQDDLGALPAPALQALHADDVKVRAVGATAEDAVGFRTVHLRLGPSTPTALNAWVRGCRAAVAALAPTTVRLYGFLPEQSLGGEPPKTDHSGGIPGLREVDDERCQRGFGVQNREAGHTRGDLRVGIRGPDGTVKDAAVDLDLDTGELVSQGFAWRRRGAPIVPIVKAIPNAGPVASLPTTKRDFAAPGASVRKVFVVEASERLRVTATCPKRDATSSMVFHPDDGNVLAFMPVAPDPGGTDAARSAACDSQLEQELRPQLRYRQAGRMVDEFWFDTYASGLGDQPGTDIRIEAAP